MNRATAACVFLRERVQLETFRFEALVLKFGSPERIWDARPDTLRNSGLFTGAQITRLLKRRGEEAAISARLEEWSKSGLNVVTCLDTEYPAALLRMPHPPSYLYRRGASEMPEPSLFVVGSPETDVEPIALAVAIGKRLAALGVVLVSNLTAGVEAAAHVGALSGQGWHLVFLPCGHQIATLGDAGVVLGKVSESGAVYSEFPPEFEPTPESGAEACRVAVGASAGVLLVGTPGPRATLAVEAADVAGKPIFYLAESDGALGALLRRAGAYPVPDPESLDRILPYL